MDLLPVAVLIGQALLLALCVRAFMRHRGLEGLLFGIFFTAAVAPSIYFWGRRWLLQQAVVFGFVALWQLTAPIMRARPVRITYRWGMGVLGLGLLMVLVDQPTDLGLEHRVPPHFNVLLASDDANVKNVVFFTSPSIILKHVEGNVWVNTATVSAGIPDDVKGKRTLYVAFLLPEGADLPERSRNSACRWEEHAEGSWASCQLNLGPGNRSDAFELSFRWKPVSHRMGMGERRILLARRQSELWGLQLSPAVRSSIHPLLVIEGNLATTDLDQAHPTPYRSHRDRVVWRLDEPVDIGDELLEVTLVDRRMRDIFNLTPEVLALAGGLLLGLASQQLAGVRTSDGLSSHGAELDRALSRLDSYIQSAEETGRATEERWRRFERRATILTAILFLTAYARRQRMRRRRS
jgi:hypothetical protein